MKSKKESLNCVQVIDEGLIANFNLANGRPIPALIIDASRRPDIKEYILAHKTQPPGDAETQWGFLLRSKSEIVLVLRSKRPTEIQFAIEFDIEKYHALIDGIMLNKGFYLFEGVVGDKVSTLIQSSSPGVLVEVPSSEFKSKWDKVLSKLIRKRYKAQGLDRKSVSRAEKDYVDSMRELWKLRNDT